MTDYLYLINYVTSYVLSYLLILILNKGEIYLTEIQIAIITLLSSALAAAATLFIFRNTQIKENSDSIKELSEKISDEAYFHEKCNRLEIENNDLRRENAQLQLEINLLKARYDNRV